MGQNKIGLPVRPLPEVDNQSERGLDIKFILTAVVLAIAGALAGWAVGH